MNELMIVENPMPSELIAIRNIFAQDNSLTFRKKLQSIELFMLNLEQTEIPVTHSFAKGVYFRQIAIPKGTVLISRYHKYEQFDMMMTGAMTIITENGVNNIKAPFSSISKPGLKRFGYAYEDVLWVDAHKTDETDIGKLEDMLYVDDYEEMEKCDIERSHADYQLVLKEFGIPHEQARLETEYMPDRSDIALDGLKISESKIDGAGIFSTSFFLQGETVCPALIKGMRTQAGRYTNHSDLPNAKPVLQENGDIDFIALRNINNEEITIDYRQSLLLSRRDKCQQLSQQ